MALLVIPRDSIPKLHFEENVFQIARKPIEREVGGLFVSVCLVGFGLLFFDFFFIVFLLLFVCWVFFVVAFSLLFFLSPNP